MHNKFGDLKAPARHKEILVPVVLDNSPFQSGEVEGRYERMEEYLRARANEHGIAKLTLPSGVSYNVRCGCQHLCPDLDTDCRFRCGAKEK